MSNRYKVQRKENILSRLWEGQIHYLQKQCQELTVSANEQSESQVLGPVLLCERYQGKGHQCEPRHNFHAGRKKEAAGGTQHSNKIGTVPGSGEDELFFWEVCDFSESNSSPGILSLFVVLLLPLKFLG